MLVAALDLVVAVAILRWSDRQSYLASGAVNVLVVSFGLTQPSWLVALGPPAVLLGVIGVVGSRRVRGRLGDLDPGAGGPAALADPPRGRLTALHSFDRLW